MVAGDGRKRGVENNIESVKGSGETEEMSKVAGAVEGGTGDTSAEQETVVQQLPAGRNFVRARRRRAKASAAESEVVAEVSSTT